MSLSLLDDARRLAENDPARMHYEWCEYCGEGQEDHGGIAYELVHEHDCPWLSMPLIVVALEAASAVMDPGGHCQDDDGICVECGGVVGASCRPDICTMAQLRALLADKDTQGAVTALKEPA